VRDRVTAADIRLALMRRFCAPEWALLFEVRDATGFAGSRSADALAMSLWPSRGLELHGMEIKVSKSDWRSERANPEKAETIAAYCDRWHLVTAAGVVDSPEEIPPAWGWIELRDGRLVTVKEAQLTDSKPCDRKFLAALLRRVSKADDDALDAEIARRDAARKEEFERRIDQAVKLRLSYRDAAIKDIEAFEAASGIKISTFQGWGSDAEDIGRAVRAVMSSGVDKAWQGLASASATLRESAEKIDTALADVGFASRARVDPYTAKRRRRSA
jgi:hypothetical protein